MARRVAWKTWGVGRIPFLVKKHNCHIDRRTMLGVRLWMRGLAGIGANRESNGLARLRPQHRFATRREGISFLPPPMHFVVRSECRHGINDDRTQCGLHWVV